MSASKELLSPIPQQTLLQYVHTHKLISQQQAAKVALSPVEYNSLLSEIYDPEVQSPEKKAQEKQNVKLTQRDHFLLRACIHKTLCKSLETLIKEDNYSTVEAYKKLAMTLDVKTDLDISTPQKYSMIARLGQLRTILNDALLDAGFVSKITSDNAINQAKQIVRGTAENVTTANNENNLNLINITSDKLAAHIAKYLSLNSKVLAVIFTENLQEEIKNIIRKTIAHDFANSPFVVPDAGLPIPALKATTPAYDENYEASSEKDAGSISDDDGYSAPLDNSSDRENSSESEISSPEPSPSPTPGNDKNFKLKPVKKINYDSSSDSEPDSPSKTFLDRAEKSKNRQRWSD
ncbi:MAG: hypothetical protein K0R98_1981 [Rickettsiaceae bacterium]|jgi:hypothetical protein|nr:hypothetical protein [Rickettsiaceae bacterium]